LALDTLTHNPTTISWRITSPELVPVAQLDSTAKEFRSAAQVTQVFFQGFHQWSIGLSVQQSVFIHIMDISLPLPSGYVKIAMENDNL